MNNRIKEIEKDINDIEKFNNIKKIILSHNQICKNIDDCKNNLENLNLTIDNGDVVLEDNFDYDKYSKELDSLKQKINENTDIEELNNIRSKANIIINKCKKYLEIQKLEIINVD